MSDGMVEWANRTIKDQLAKYLYTREGVRDDHLQQVEVAYNTVFTHPPNTLLTSWPMEERPVCLLISYLETSQEFQMQPQVCQVNMPLLL